MTEREPSWADFEPRDDVERQASARAIIQLREGRGEVEAIRALTDLERALIRRAYTVGKQDILRAVERVVGKAETVRVDVVRDAAVQAYERDGLNPYATAITQDEFIRNPHGWADRRVGSLVLGARADVERGIR
jgi:hypothetical protein